MKKTFRYETHVHTAECDGSAALGAAEIVRRYAEAGYAGLIITDHIIDVFEKRWFPEEVKGLDHEQYITRWLRGYHAAKEEGDRLGLTVLLGGEVRFDGQINDYLIYGLDEDFFYTAPRLNRCQSLEELLALLPPDVCVVQAHPFRDKMVVADPSLLWGLEGFNGGNPKFRNELAKIYAEHYGKAITSGSDYHGRRRFASGGIETEEEIRTPQDLTRILRSGRYTLIENYKTTDSF